jgi:molybdopterin-biosynthesis enzyme MoeA-like protein
MMKSRGREMNAARLKMAMVPQGARLIRNSISLAPGFRIDNVFVLAGVPKIAEVMFFALEDQLEGAAEILSRSLDAYAPEGDIALPLQKIADARPTVEIGSYPFNRDGRFGANLVVRGTDSAEVTSTIQEIAAVIGAMGVEIEMRG